VVKGKRYSNEEGFYGPGVQVMKKSFCNPSTGKEVMKKVLATT
jgi:hypothetical protein